jgi:hypothetical protein
MLMSASDGIVKLAATRSLNHALSGQNQLRLIAEFHSGGLKHFVQGNHRAVSQFFPDTAFRLTPERRGLAQMGSSFAGDLDRSNAAIVGIFDADNQPQHLERLQIAVQCRRMLSEAPRKGADREMVVAVQCLGLCRSLLCRLPGRDRHFAASAGSRIFPPHCYRAAALHHARTDFLAAASVTPAGLFVARHYLALDRFRLQGGAIRRLAIRRPLWYGNSRSPASPPGTSVP